MIHLTTFDIIATHDETIKRYGGLSGAVDPLKADVLIERVRNHEHYQGLTDVFALAALYCVAIARGHIFLDGNKRTAINCTWDFLKLNGVQTYAPRDLEETVIKVATGERKADAFADYLRMAFSSNEPRMRAK